MSPEIPTLWPRLMDRVPEIGGLLEPRVSYGVMQMREGNAGGLMDLAGVSVADPTASVPAGMTAITLPAGRCAVFELSLPEIGPAFDPAAPSSRMEVYMPVQARAD